MRTAYFIATCVLVAAALTLIAVAASLEPGWLKILNVLLAFTGLSVAAYTGARVGDRA